LADPDSKNRNKQNSPGNTDNLQVAAQSSDSSPNGILLADKMRFGCAEDHEISVVFWLLQSFNHKDFLMSLWLLDRDRQPVLT
jgi:hypothetical protein